MIEKLSVDWRVKALLQNFLSAVPGGVHLNHLAQRILGELKNPHLSSRLDNSIEIGKLVKKYSEVPVEELTVMEIGTGWIPATPLLLSLMGAKRIITCDIVRHLKHKVTVDVIHQYQFVFDKLSKALDIDVNQIAAQHNELAKKGCLEDRLERLLSSWNIEYSAPFDARKTNLKDGEIDLVYSSLVLEHVPLQEIRELLKEFKRVLSHKGCMIHVINLCDHFIGFDSSITPYNFLKYSEKKWRFWGMNKFNFQNRLRAVDYYRAVEEAGFAIVYKDEWDEKEKLIECGIENLAEPYRMMSPEELAVTRISLVCRHR